MRRRIRKAIRYRLARLKWKWWSVQNWRKGYKFGPIQRHRCCDHTTPHHYRTCPAAICGEPHPTYGAPCIEFTGHRCWHSADLDHPQWERASWPADSDVPS